MGLLEFRYTNNEERRRADAFEEAAQLELRWHKALVLTLIIETRQQHLFQSITVQTTTPLL